MKVGFTGTRKDIKPEGQLFYYFEVLDKVAKTAGDEKELHVGMAIGADFTASRYAKNKGWRLVGHPSTIGPQRRDPGCDEVREAKPPLERNQDIVDETVVLIATPGQMQEVQRSGTWATIRRARKAKKTRFIIYPDGVVVKEHPDGSISFPWRMHKHKYEARQADG